MDMKVSCLVRRAEVKRQPGRPCITEYVYWIYVTQDESSDRFL